MAKFHDKYFYRDGSAKRCVICLSRDLGTNVIDTLDYTVCEYEEYCKKCHTRLAYWSYGYYDPDWRMTTEDEFKEIRRERSKDERLFDLRSKAKWRRIG